MGCEETYDALTVACELFLPVALALLLLLELVLLVRIHFIARDVGVCNCQLASAFLVVIAQIHQCAPVCLDE